MQMNPKNDPLIKFVNEKLKCPKCNYFFIKRDCSLCEKCEKYDLEQFALESNNQIFKSVKVISKELN
jgi:hypothetical protein